VSSPRTLQKLFALGVSSPACGWSLDLLHDSVARFQDWRKLSESRTALAAIFTVGTLGLLARILALFKAVMIARLFGSSGNLDAFYIALLLPYGLINVISGSIGVAFIPNYLYVKQHSGPDAAKRLFSSVSSLSLIVFLTLSALLAPLAEFILRFLAPGFDFHRLAVTSNLFLIMLPFMALSGVAAIWAFLLNAEGQFSVASLSQCASPIVLVAALSVLTEKWGVYALATGTLLGALAELTIVGWELQRRGFSLLPRWHGYDEGMRSFVRQFTPGIGGSLSSSGSQVVDQSMASMLPSGSVASLNYGMGMVAAVLSIVANALGTAMLPSFSRLVSIREWGGVRRLLRNYLVLAFLAGLVPMLLLIALSSPLTALLYQRGAFSAADTQLVAQIQMAYALQLPAYLMATVVVRLLAALQRVWVRTIGGVGNLLMDVLLNYWLMRRMGIVGIAASTSVVCTMSFLYLGLMLRRELAVAAGRPSPVPVILASP